MTETLIFLPRLVLVFSVPGPVLFQSPSSYSPQISFPAHLILVLSLIINSSSLYIISDTFPRFPRAKFMVTQSWTTSDGFTQEATTLPDKAVIVQGTIAPTHWKGKKIAQRSLLYWACSTPHNRSLGPTMKTDPEFEVHLQEGTEGGIGLTGWFEGHSFKHACRNFSCMSEINRCVHFRVVVDRIGVYFEKKKKNKEKSSCSLVDQFPNQRIPSTKSSLSRERLVALSPKG